MDNQIKEAKALELDLVDVEGKYLMPDAEDLLIKYKRLEGLVKELKELIGEKVKDFFDKNSDIKMERIEGRRIYVSIGQANSYTIVGDAEAMYEDKKLRPFMKIEYKPNSEAIKEYLEKEGKLPEGFSQDVATRVYIKEIKI